MCSRDNAESKDVVAVCSKIISDRSRRRQLDFLDEDFTVYNWLRLREERICHFYARNNLNRHHNKQYKIFYHLKSIPTFFLLNSLFIKSCHECDRRYFLNSAGACAGTKYVKSTKNSDCSQKHNS